MPIKVEKDFTVVLATSEMASNSEMRLCNTMRILKKYSDWILKKDKVLAPEVQCYHSAWN